MQIEYKVIKDSRGFIVIRSDYPYSFHAHIKTMSTVRLLLGLISKNLLPTNQYLQGSCRRLLTEEEYSQLKQKKQHYINRR